MSIMSAAFIQDAITAESNGEQFPINFDNVWSLVGYSTKGNGKRVLENNLIKDYDFAFINSDKWSQSGRLSETIVLTIEGFKHFCLLAQTKEGHECRQYFIDVEKAYRQNLERQLLGNGSSQVEALQLEIVQLKERVEYVTGKALYWERKAFTTELSEDLKGNDTQFKYDAVRLWLITGITDYKYLTQCIERDYHFGVDFVKKNWTKEERKAGMSQGRYKFLLTSDAAISVVTSHRSRAGCLKSAVPEEYHFLFDIPLDDSENKQNRRRLQSR